MNLNRSTFIKMIYLKHIAPPGGALLMMCLLYGGGNMESLKIFEEMLNEYCPEIQFIDDVFAIWRGNMESLKRFD